MFSWDIGRVFFAPNFQMLLPYYNNIALALVQCLTLVSFISSEIIGYQRISMPNWVRDWYNGLVLSFGSQLTTYYFLMRSISNQGDAWNFFQLFISDKRLYLEM